MLPPKILIADDLLLKKARSLVEEQLGWGSSEAWTNQDFTSLSEQIFSKTGVNLSPTTLKRVWGRVKYNSAPSTTTLDALVLFVGYENWRAFKAYRGNGATLAHPVILQTNEVKHNEVNHLVVPAKKPHVWWKAGLLIVVAGAFVLGVYDAVFWHPITINPDDYRFSSKTVVTQGVPNTVIFDFDASQSPYDTVIIQQSWDRALQAKLPKDQRQHSSIYYYPNNFRAKLIVGQQVVKQHNLLIKSNGWLPVIEQSPVPIYLKKQEVMVNGLMQLTVGQLKARNFSMTVSPPTLDFINVQEYGEIYTDHFVFETAVRNTFREGAGVCQNTLIYLNCVGNVIWIPLCAKGCVSEVDLAFTDYYRSGKELDLSAFGVDFNAFVKVRIESKNAKARIFINDQLVHTVSEDLARAKIIGISYRFLGAGAVDYVRLSNEKVNFEDTF